MQLRRAVLLLAVASPWVFVADGLKHSDHAEEVASAGVPELSALAKTSALATSENSFASMSAALDHLSASRSPPASASDLEELVSFFRDSRAQGTDLKVWKTVKKPQCHSNQTTVFFPTVPRSGNFWTRYALEEASGVATWAVWDEEECSRHKHCPCGISRHCDHVHWPELGKEANLLKLHHPFIPSLPRWINPPVERAMLTIRNPFDNFDAWLRYSKRKDDFSWFMDRWTSHFLYWIRKSRNECMQLTMVRYEDMTHNQEEVLHLMQDAVRFTSFNVSRALAKYPPERNQVAKHLDSHPESVSLALKSAAKGLGEKQRQLMELLGYGSFISKITV